MKRIATILPLLFIAAGLFSQVAFTGISWVGWENEPDYEGVTGYAENPYDNPVYVAPMAEGVSLDMVTDAASFDVAWGMLGDAMYMTKIIQDPANGDPYDLDENGDGTFGASWKAVHDGANLYVLTKYVDTNSQLDEGTHNYEVMVQPTSYFRHENTFAAASDSAAEHLVAYQNQAYARVIELGGGKAVFKDGMVSEYAASVGLARGTAGAGYYNSTGWGANEHGLEALGLTTHFWDATDGVIRGVLVMSFDGALGYPADPTDLAGDYIAVEPGDTISFDIKSRGAIDGNSVEYHWSSDKNNCYASNYYAGWLVLEEGGGEEVDVAFTGISWVGWENEPDYEGVTGYADNPYDQPEVDVLKAPATWTFEGITDAASFDATWNILGDAMYMTKIIQDPANGDPYDLDENGDGTFGASWKGVHDGANLYVLTKYVDTNSQLDEGTHNYEVMVQPTSPFRHENTFAAASDSAAEHLVAYQNQAYARVIELGGGKAVFKDGMVSEYAASVGLARGTAGAGYYNSTGWGANEHGLEALGLTTHFWDATDGVIRGVLVMSFDGALGYPADPTDLAGDYIAVEVGETISFDIKSRGAIDGNSVEYHWSSDKNNCYASNYYAGLVTLKDEVISGIEPNQIISPVKVFIYNDILNIRGVEYADVKIYSITGALVKAVPNASGQVDMSGLIDGVYLVKLEGIPTGFKVVK